MNPDAIRALADRLDDYARQVRYVADQIDGAQRLLTELKSEINTIEPVAAELADSVEKLRAEKTALETELRLLVDARARAAVEEEAARRNLDGALQQLKADAEREAALIMAERKARASEHIQAMAALENAISAKRLELRAFEDQVAAKKAD